MSTLQTSVPLPFLARSPGSTRSHPEANLPRGMQVQIQSLSKHYGDRRVLDDISLNIAPGEFVAIVGRSGCGKSTLLRLLAGLETVQGHVDLDHQPLHAKAAASRGVRMMFQEARLLPWRRVGANVGLGLPPEGRQQRVEDVLSAVGLLDRINDWPANLSGGQRQRVALARALIHRPRLLLLDEPLGALDALTRIEMQQLIESLWRDHGFTAVLVTHDVGEAVALADRVLLIEDQRIALDTRIELPHPRERGNPLFARYEDDLLQRVLQA